MRMATQEELAQMRQDSIAAEQAMAEARRREREGPRPDVDGQLTMFGEEVRGSRKRRQKKADDRQGRLF